MGLIEGRFALTNQGEEFFEDLAAELAVPENRYEQARASYRSLGEWFHRDESAVRRFDPQIYAQGSFRLGTAIKPSSEDEEYDVDSICLCHGLTKSTVTQYDLKRLLGAEIEAYRKSKNMVKPLKEGRKCWVLSYADGAQFHMDIVPAVPNAQGLRRRLEEARLSTEWADTAVGITDNETAGYYVITDDWPRSNPKGYSNWFKRRTTVLLERRQRRSAGQVQAEVENLPTFKLKMPLQSAVMILKRHRNLMFAERPADGPISVIITTLAAHAYNGEAGIGEALVAILARMDRYIEDREGVPWIANPTDPFENFADKWVNHPERRAAFYEWLRAAREAFIEVARLTDRQAMTDTASGGVGRVLAERARDRRRGVAKPSLLTSGFIRDEAAMRREAVQLRGNNRSA